ncbi:hypothetical protein ACHQM5_001042 [Ranunculus cassubicifolius]
MDLLTFFLLVWFPLAAHSKIYQHIPLPPGLTGPESVEFDCKGEGPYSGLSDGRIFKFQGRKHGWKEFAYTSPMRNRSLCDGTSDIKLQARCGRTLGLKFHMRTCELYIADAYYGLMKVGRNGGGAVPIVTSAEGTPLRFTNSLEIDVENHVIYFTDSSTRYQLDQDARAIKIGDSTGRFLKYNLRTKKVTVLLRGLKFANGVALSKKKDYAIVCELGKGEILRYWLKGPKAHTSEFFVRTPGPPDNINRNAKGEFWVGVITRNTTAGAVIGVRIDENGKILQRLIGDDFYGSVSEVEERNGHLLIGSIGGPNFLGITTV